MSSRTYGNLIWTDHALERLAARKLSQELAWSAFRHPDKTISGKLPGSYEYQRHYQNSLITLIAKQNEKREWVVLSCWIDPPLAGTKDEHQTKAWHTYQKASWWMKWFLTFKKQLGF